MSTMQPTDTISSPVSSYNTYTLPEKKSEHSQIYSSTATRSPQLPDETLEYLLSFLPMPEQKACRFVCKKWDTILTDSILLKNIKKIVEKVLSLKPDEPMPSPLRMQIDHIFFDPKTAKCKEKAVCILFQSIQSVEPYKQNHLVDRIIIENFDEASVSLKDVFNNHHATNTIKLHLMTKEKATRYLASELAAMAPIQTGIIMKDPSHFKNKIVRKELIPSLSISPGNQFAINELVAIDYRGDFCDDYRCLWYGIVQDITVDKDGKPLYTVCRELHKQRWLNKKIVSAEMVGKIPSWASSYLPKHYQLGNLITG